jgi:hypothetical protein
MAFGSLATRLHRIAELHLGLLWFTSLTTLALHKWEEHSASYNQTLNIER